MTQSFGGLESIEQKGFEPFRIQSEKPIIIYVKKYGKYFASAGGTCIGYFKLTTLAELHLMSVDQLKEGDMKYKHKKTGNIYEMINIANECDTEKFPRMVVYFSLNDGEVYARPFDDFMSAFEFIGE